MADPSQPSPGDLAFAHYRVERHADGSVWELGRGAMGVTYKAHDLHLRVDVALKVINPAQVGDAKTQALFLREARAAARVNHSNVAHVVFLSQDPANPFYAMEFIAGESLREWMQTRCPLAPLLAIGLAEQIALGLQAIHAESVVHRDLKPGNVMIVRAAAGREKGASETDPATWQAKIIDFGLARGFAGDSLSSNAAAVTTGFRGTAVYASPEQCQERVDIDGRSDLYSLGCILWEMLVGAPPFRGSSLHEILMLHVSRPAPVARLSHLPASLQAVVAKLLAKDPDARFANATAVAKALEHCRERILSGAEGLDESSPPSELETVVSAEGPPSTRKTTAPISSRTAGAPAESSSRSRVLLGALGVIALGGIVVTAGLMAGWWRGSPRIADKAPPVTVVAVTPTPIPPEASVVAMRPTPTPIPDKSIAVLPFENLSDEKDSAYFADGMQDDVLSSLAKIKDIKVVARTSLRAYGGAIAAGRLREVGQALGVAHVLEGRIRRSGDRVLLTVQLVDTRDDRQVWGERYDRTLADSLTLQGELAQEIARALKATLTAGERAQVDDAATKDTVAYELYWRARKMVGDASFFKTSTLEAQLKAYGLLEEAIKRDPTFLVAHCYMAGLGDILYVQTGKKREWMTRAEDSLAAAVRLQPDAGETLLAQGRHLYRALDRRAEARVVLAQAAQKLPNDPEVYIAMAQIDRREGKWDDCVSHYRRALELDPQNTSVLGQLGSLLGRLRRWPEKNEMRDRGIALTVPPQRWMLQLSRDKSESLRSANLDPFRARVAAILAADPEAMNKGIAPDAWILAEYERDEAAMERALNAFPTDDVNRRGQMLVSLATIRGDPAARAQAALPLIPALEKRVQDQPNDLDASASLALFYAAANRKDDAIREGRRGYQIATERAHPFDAIDVGENLAVVYAMLGEKLAAIELLESLSRMPSEVWYGSLLLKPTWDPLRAEPRFQALLASTRPADAAK